MLVPAFQYGIHSGWVCLSRCWPQVCLDQCCGLLGSYPIFHQQGASGGLGEAPSHVEVVEMVVAEICLLFNQPDGFGGGASIGGEGDRLFAQSLVVLYRCLNKSWPKGN